MMAHMWPIRAVRRCMAWSYGYFWLPCPCCGRMFGGHECGEKSVPSIAQPGILHMCCKWCDEVEDG